MPSVRKFHTGLVPVGNIAKPEPLYNGSRWYATIEKRMMEISGRNEKEIVIYAKTWITAQQALYLIVSSLSLFEGSPPACLEEFVAHNNNEPQNVNHWKKKQIFSQYFSTVGFLTACAIAAKASRNRKYAYAISKYMFSISQYSQYAVDLEPHRSAHLSISPFYCDHILFSHSIIAAYSAIEELGFNIPASSSKPSMKGGRWNPEVKTKLEDKLNSTGINLKDKLLWTIRGSKRKIEKKKQPHTLQKLPWSQGQVCDANIEVIDAINYASWLRSHVASHKTSDLVSSLSPYDVINVQHLARRLILECLGFWRLSNIFSVNSFFF